MSPHATRIVFEFHALPATAEKELLEKQYCDNDIGIFDFLAKAEKYINKIKG